MNQPSVKTIPTPYPKVSFKKCVVLNHQKTISMLTFHNDKDVLKNPTIKRCLDMHYSDERYRIFNFLVTIVLVKIGTKVIHMNRALALSAPRTWKSVAFKYFIVPYFVATYQYVKNVKKTILSIQNQVKEDTQADELWQPVFEKNYPDLSQPFYSTPFMKFNLEDVLQQSPNSKSALV